MTDTAVGATRACILFRTHFWDEFAQRQFDRLLQNAGSTDVFVLVDETRGRVEGIPHDRVVRVTESEILAMGFAPAGEGNLLWFNGDYPLYRFLELQPGYDLILQLEYDVVIDGPIEAMLARAAAGGVDFVGLTKGEASRDWPWLPTCTDAYAAWQVEHQLICLSIFSARALRHLWQRRLDHSARYREGDLVSWPMCEGFIATELLLGGFVCRELSEFGDTAQYDHWPPFLEADVQTAPQNAPGVQTRFIHPVLDQERFVSSMLKYHVGIAGYLNPGSLFHRKLRRLPVRRYASAVTAIIARKAATNLRSALGARAAPMKKAS